MSFLNKSLAFIKIGASMSLAYRSMMIFWTVIHIASLALIYYLWLAIFETKGMVGIYTLPLMITYYFVASFVQRLTINYYEYSMSEDIRSGQVTNDLVKPFYYPMYRILMSVVWHVMQAVLLIAIYGVLVYLTRDIFIWTLTWGNVPWLLLTIGLSFVFFATSSCIVGTLAFWIVDISQVVQMKSMAIMVLSGMFIPIDLLPAWLSQILLWTPFPYLVYFPAKIFLNQVSGTELTQGLLILSVYVALSIVGMVWMWQRGIRKFEAIGQ